LADADCTFLKTLGFIGLIPSKVIDVIGIGINSFHVLNFVARPLSCDLISLLCAIQNENCADGFTSLAVRLERWLFDCIAKPITDLLASTKQRFLMF